jgi:hypothetical protein
VAGDILVELSGVGFPVIGDFLAEIGSQFG